MAVKISICPHACPSTRRARRAPRSCPWFACYLVLLLTLGLWGTWRRGTNLTLTTNASGLLAAVHLEKAAQPPAPKGARCDLQEESGLWPRARHDPPEVRRNVSKWCRNSGRSRLRRTTSTDFCAPLPYLAWGDGSSTAHASFGYTRADCEAGQAFGRRHSHLRRVRREEAELL